MHTRGANAGARGKVQPVHPTASQNASIITNHGLGVPPQKRSLLFYLGLPSLLILFTIYYMNSATTMDLLRMPAEMQAVSFSMISNGGGGLTLEQTESLRSLLEELKEEAALYEEEIPAPFMKQTITTPFRGEIQDRHQVVNEDCPRYVTMMKPGHGMGHQMGTFTTAMITALFFNLTYVDAPYADSGVHGTYPGIADFTGLSEGEHLLEEVEKKVEKVIQITEMPVEPTSDNLQILYEPLREAFDEKYGKECSVLFKVNEYYSYDYGSFTKGIVARKFKEAPHRKPITLEYDPNEFIIAIHIRVGDITPTSEAYFMTVLSQILPAVKDVPYRVHAFAEKKGANDYPGLVQLVGDRVTFHPDMPPFESFYHLTQAHVFIMSASGFSQFPAVAGTKALQFSPPSRESFPLKFCPPYAVCCNKEGKFELEGLLRLKWRVDRWRRRLRLKTHMNTLENVLSLGTQIGVDSPKIGEEQ